MKNVSIQIKAIAWVSLFILPQACIKDNIDKGEDPAPSEISSFQFTAANNPSLVYDVVAEISGDTLYAYTFAGVDVTGLVADFEYSGSEVRVDGTVQESGNSQQDFTDLVDYQVYHANGDTRTYTVKLADTGIPAIYVSTGGQPILNKEDYVDGSFKIVRGFDAEPLHEGELEIRGRGNSTWEMPRNLIE